MITTSQKLADEVNREIEKQLAELERREIAAESLANGGVIAVVESIEQAIELSNMYAPEHLCLDIKGAKNYIDKIINVAGIAKKDDTKGEKEDKVFLPGRANPINFGRDEDLLLFLQRIRNEAHRFALTYHRKKRSDKTFQSILDTIPGIGEKRKKMLLMHYGGIGKIKNASIDELRQLPGMNIQIAKELKKYVSNDNM